LWDDTAGETHSMRGKEEAHDYRYFPDPDLVPVVIDDAWIAEIRKTMPELPLEKRERFIRDYQISVYDAGVLTATPASASFYESTIASLDSAGKINPKAAKTAINWITGDLMKMLNEDKKDFTASPIPPKAIAELIQIVDAGTISGKMAKDVVEEMYKSGKMPGEIVKEKGLVQITDEGALAKTISDVIENNPTQVEQYRGGREKLFGFFVGQVMKATQGKANPKLINDLLKRMLAG
ncbi:MAG: Asp-tRNA(Asn)/Glu-tRNA(Gln) amidotransferase GatCAB subunit B, partial [Syntrophales bacterium]|nr:Asp-tRNA(Asn)/Glu-tRNA(Gln) amidotransferase GatCAB subunit B [Syntrophales bacterium]